jgi:hypothetical protein
MLDNRVVNANKWLPLGVNLEDDMLSLQGIIQNHSHVTKSTFTMFTSYAEAFKNQNEKPVSYNSLSQAFSEKYGDNVHILIDPINMLVRPLQESLQKPGLTNFDRMQNNFTLVNDVLKIAKSALDNKHYIPPQMWDAAKVTAQGYYKSFGNLVKSNYTTSEEMSVAVQTNNTVSTLLMKTFHEKAFELFKKGGYKEEVGDEEGEVLDDEEGEEKVGVEEEQDPLLDELFGLLTQNEEGVSDVLWLKMLNVAKIRENPKFATKLLPFAKKDVYFSIGDWQNAVSNTIGFNNTGMAKVESEINNLIRQIARSKYKTPSVETPSQEYVLLDLAYRAFKLENIEHYSKNITDELIDKTAANLDKNTHLQNETIYKFARGQVNRLQTERGFYKSLDFLWNLAVGITYFPGYMKTLLVRDVAVKYLL